MKGPDIITKNELSLDKTVNLKKLIGKDVLSKGGKIIGKVAEIRMDPKNLDLEGVLVRGDNTKNSMYIGRGYFSRLSEEAVILNIEVSVLIKGRKVITSDGKVLGKVKKVMRNGTRNDLKEISVKSLFSKKFLIPSSAIDYVGASVVLKPNYNARKKYFWQSNK